MSDTPTLGDALEKASSLTNEKGEKIQEETPEDSKPEAKEETKPVKEEVTEKAEKPSKSEKEEKPKETKEVKEVEQPKESKKDKETLDRIDPTSIPEKLKPLYDNLMAGFTKGRQQDREEVKKLKKQLEEIKPKTESESEEPPQFKTPQEYYTWEAKKAAKEVVRTERQDSFRKEALSYYNAADSRLNNEKDDHDPIVDAVIGSQLDEKLADHEKEHGSEIGFDYKSNIKQLLENWDQYLEGHIKNYISRQNKLTKEKAKDFQKKAPIKSNPAKISLNKKMSLNQAMEAALEKTK